jgi:hypothetical protein
VNFNLRFIVRSKLSAIFTSRFWQWLLMEPACEAGGEEGDERVKERSKVGHEKA